MKRTIALVSLRFNPAFVQHLIAYAKAVRELGYEPQFILDAAYQAFSELKDAASIRQELTCDSAGHQSHAVFLNASTKNRDLAIALKKNGTKILYVFHEPWQMSLRYLWNEGLLSGLKGAMAHHFTVPVLKIAHTVILASQNGILEYQKSDVRHNSNVAYLPLLYDDEAGQGVLNDISQKRFLSYIGNICRSHAFDRFLSFVQFSLQRDRNLSFLIASRNPMPDRLMKDRIFLRNAERIEMRCGRELSNAEINRCYAESFCVWNLYRRSTQSGVLPKAFMFGTPVIAGRVGSFGEFVQDGVNGRFAGPRDGEEIQAAATDMRINIARYASHCREAFLRTFYYRAHLQDLARLLG